MNSITVLYKSFLPGRRRGRPGLWLDKSNKDVPSSKQEKNLNWIKENFVKKRQKEINDDYQRDKKDWVWYIPNSVYNLW